jgi:enoyl-CoA hydratase
VSEGRLIYHKDGVVGRIVFDNPSALNALTWSMWKELGRVCEDIARDASLRVVTLRGAGGKAFLSGTDIGGFLSFETGQDGVEYEREMDRYISAVEALPFPTLAIVEGWAVGGGVALSGACDFRIAATTAKFGSPLGRTIGNCLSAKGYARLVRLVGVAQAKRMLMLGEIVPAAELKALGVLLDVVEPDDIDDAAAVLCERLAHMAPLTLKATKEAMRRQTYASVPDIDDLIAEVYGSEDFRNGVRRFVNKDKPLWKGR